MEALVQYLDTAGVDSSCLDETIADYVIQLAREGGTEHETWSVLEGCYPELEESAESRQAFSKLLTQLRHPSVNESLKETTQTPPNGYASSLNQTAEATGSVDGVRVEGRGQAGRTGGDETDVNFLREMMPHVSDRGLRYVLHYLSGGSSVAAASYLADRCAGAGSTLGRLEADAEAAEAKDLERIRKAEQATARAEEATKRDKAELNAFKSKIVDRYADEAEGSSSVKVVVPSTKAEKKRTRYRDGKVVTTTGAKVIVEDVKPEWDGGSRGKVKTKGKRGKGFV